MDIVMDPSTDQTQEMNGTQSMMLNICSKKPRPLQAVPAEQSLKCPRCDSTNTKFCYYNNYSLSQPRYFCKSCRRYWTKGGTLRNVPVGGGCRKNNKLRSKRSSSSSTQSELSDPIISSNTSFTNTQIPLLTYDHAESNNHDLTLAFARLHQNKLQPTDHNNFHLFENSNYADNFNPSPNSTHGFLDSVLRSNGFVDTQSNFNQNLYFGIDADHNNNNNSTGTGELMQLPNYGDGHQQVNYTNNGMKQEIERENYENGKVLWGFPWQNGEINLDSGKDQSWNVTKGLNWQYGLINSPLM